MKTPQPELLRNHGHVAPDESELTTSGLRLAGLQAGDSFLDVAAGPGGVRGLPLFISAAQAVVHEFEGLAEDEPMLEFQVADPDVLRQRMVDAGLRDLTVDTSNEERITVQSGQQSGIGPSAAIRCRGLSSPSSRTSSVQTSSECSTG